MKKPNKYLIDSLIEYAQECGIGYGEASTIVSDFARQRAPELAGEKQIDSARFEMERTIESSQMEYLISRFLVVSRVRYIAWTYYPEYHVCSEARNFSWCSIKFIIPSWPPKRLPDEYYIDNLYHDKDASQFWMHEPYINELPESKALFGELTKDKYECLSGTKLRKVDPRIVSAFKKKRKGTPEYMSRSMPDDYAYREPFYGSNGWKQRVKLIPVSYRKMRLR